MRKVKVLEQKMCNEYTIAKVQVGFHIYNMQYNPVYGLFISGVADAFEYLPNEADDIETLLDDFYNKH